MDSQELDDLIEDAEGWVEACRGEDDQIADLIQKLLDAIKEMRPKEA